jgi:hypothetical protein
MRQALLRQHAVPADVDYRASRGLYRRLIYSVIGGAKVDHLGGAKVGQLHRAQGSAWRA